MKKIALAVLLSGVLFSIVQAEKLNIAVSDLTGRGVDESSTAIISDRLRTALFKEGGFSVLERNAMQDVLKEQGFQQSGCTSDACAIEIGQLLGVSYIVVGTVGKIGRLFTIDVRMIQVSTGKIVYSENVDCECPIERVLTGSVSSIAKKISQNVGTNPNAVKPAGTNAQKSNLQAGSTENQSQDKTDAETKKGAASGNQKPKKSPVFTITFCAGTLAFAGAGYACDMIVKQKVKNSEGLAAEYKSLPGNDRYLEYQTKIDANNKTARQFQALRTVSYVLAGACATGFVITILF